MPDHFISTDNFFKLVNVLLAESPVVAPVEYQSSNVLQAISAENIKKINLFGYRAVESLKEYFFKPVELVSDYFANKTGHARRKLAIIGLRGCDLEAISVLDKVYLEGDTVDPFYKENREEVLLIGADCTTCGKTCFCTLVDGKPYPIKLFDINLSLVEGGFIVEVASEHGNELVKKNIQLFEEAPQYKISQKERTRERAVSELNSKNDEFKLKIKLSDAHKVNLENSAWKTMTKDCVECAACNFTCPTCSCFLLADQQAGANFERFKLWDGCLKASYAKVAGGANERGKLYKRLQNRYHCKFDYSYDRLGRYACVGCGRCIDSCAGAIDMRKIFVELERQVPLMAKIDIE